MTRPCISMTLLSGICLSGMLLPPAPSFSEEPVAADACVVQLALPDGAKVNVDGQPYGDKRRLVFNHLEPGLVYPAQFEIALPQGGAEHRTVLIRGGWLVQLSLAAPDAAVPQMVLQAYERRIRSGAFSPDGRLVALGASDGPAVVCDASTGQILRTFRQGRVWSWPIAFSPDGVHLLIGADDYRLVLWDVTTGKELRVFSGHKAHINNIAFSPDGKHILSGDDDKQAILWDAQSGKPLLTVAAGKRSVQAVAFGPNGQFLTGSDDQKVTLWDAASGNQVRVFEGAGNEIRWVAFSPDGAHVFADASKYDYSARTCSSEVLLWETASGRLLKVARNDNRHDDSATLNADGRQLAVGGFKWQDGKMVGVCAVYDANSLETIHEFGPSVDRYAIPVFSPDGQRVLVLSSEEASLCDPATGKPTQRLGDRTRGVGVGSATPDGKCAIMSSSDAAIVWDLRTGQTRQAFDLRPFESQQIAMYKPYISPGGQQVLVSGWLNKGKETPAFSVLWDVSTGRRLHDLRGHSSMLCCAAFSPDERQLATAAYDSVCVLWETSSGKERHRIKLESSPNAMVFSPDGRLLVVGVSRTATIFDTESGKAVRSLEGLSDSIAQIAFTHDGKRVMLATGRYGDQATLQLRDVGSGDILGSFPQVPPKVRTLALSPDDRLVLIGSEDATMALWDVETATLLRTFQAGTAQLSAAAFSADGRRIITLAGRATAQWWDVATGDRLLDVFNLEGEQQWLAITPEGLFDGSESARKLIYYRVGAGLEVAPVPAVARRYHHPDLLAEISAGKRPLPGKSATEGLSELVQTGSRAEAKAGSGEKPQPPAQLSEAEEAKAAAQRVAQLKSKDETPADRCVVQLSLPAGATIKIDDTDYGETKTLSFDQLAPGQRYVSQATIHNADGTREQRSLVIEGGRTIRLVSRALAKQTAEPVLQAGHRGYIRSLDFTRDGRYLVSLSNEAAIVWDVATGRQLRTFLSKSREPFQAAALSPDGQRLILAGYHDVDLWEIATGRQIVRLPKRDSSVDAIAFTPDGREVVLSGSVPELWDLSSGKRVVGFEGLTGSAKAVGVTDDGRLLITAGWGYSGPEKQGDHIGEMFAWELATGARLRKFEGHAKGIDRMVISPDGRLVASLTGYPEKKVFLWDTATARRLRSLEPQNPDHESYAIAFSPDGKYVLGGGYDLNIWEADTGKLVRTIDVPGSIQVVAYTPDGRQLVAATSDMDIVFFDAASGKPGQRFPGEFLEVDDVAFSPDGTQILTCVSQYGINLWDPVGGTRIRTYKTDTSVRSARFSPDGRRVIFGGGSDGAVIRVTGSGALWRLLSGRAAEQAIFSPDGTRVLTAGDSSNHAATYWDLQTGRMLQTLAGHKETIRCLAFSPDGRSAVTGSDDRSAIVWDLETGEIRHKLLRKNAMFSVQFSPDGRQVLTGGDGAVLWDAATGQPLRDFAEEEFRFIPVTRFSPDGRQVLLANSSETVVRLYDAATGQQVQSFPGHTGEVNCAAFRPDGRQLLTGSDDGTARLWDVASGGELASLIALDRSRQWLVMTPEGLYEGSEDALARVMFRVGNRLEVEPLPAFRQRELLTRLCRGERPLPGSELVQKHVPAIVKFSSHGSGRVDDSAIELQVEVSDQGGGLGQLAVLQEQADVGEPDHTDRDGNTARSTFRLHLAEGPNRFRATALGPDGIWSAEPAEIILFYDGPPLAAKAEPNPPPADTCIVEFNLPEGATVSVDGSGYGARRKLSFDGLQAGQRYESEVLVHFREGGQTSRKIFIEGGRTVRLALAPPSTNRPEVVLQTGHAGPVAAITFSSDGKYCLTASSDRSAVLWDAATWKRLRVFPGHGADVQSAAFSPDGSQILTAAVRSLDVFRSEGEVNVWDTVTGKRLHAFQGYRGAFDPGGREVVVTPDDPVVYELSSEGQLRKLEGHTKPVFSVAFAANGGRLLTASAAEAILWDARSATKLHTFTAAEPISAAALRADGRRVVTAQGDLLDQHRCSMTVWDAVTGQVDRQFKDLPGHVHAAAFSPDGTRLITGLSDSTSILWDVETAAQLQILRGHRSDVRCATFTSNGQEIVTGGDDHRLIVWDAETGQLVRSIDGSGSGELATKPMSLRAAREALAKSLAATQGYHGGVMSLAISRDARFLLAGSDDRVLAFWDTRKGMQTSAVPGQGGLVTSVAISNDNRWLLSGSTDDTAMLYDRWTGESRTLEVGSVNVVVFSPDSKQFLTGGHRFEGDVQRGTLTLWDAIAARPIRQFSGHSDDVSTAAFRSDGLRIISGSRDKTAIIWDAATGQPLHTLQATEMGVSAVAFNPNGRQVLTAQGFALIQAPGVVALWDADSGVKMNQFQAHANSVLSAAFSPDGRQILTTSADGTAVVWNAQTQQKIRSFEGHADSVMTGASTPDGRMLLTGSADNTVRLWDIDTGEELARLISLESGKDWLAVTPDGFFDGSASGRQRVNFRVGGGLNVVPVDRFFQDFYRPGLLTELFLGQRPMPGVQFAETLPPRIRIVSPTRATPAAKDQVSLEVEVEDLGGGVRGPWLFHNGSRVLATGVSERRGRSLHRTFNVPLVEGENRLEVRAATADGSWEAEPAAMVIRHEKPQQKPELYFIAVAIDRYLDSKMQLKFAAVDAQALMSLFEQRGPVLYQRVHAMPLINQQATRAGILATIEQTATHARPQDTVIVFLAGQGVLLGQHYYFLPQDFAHGTTDLEKDIRQHGILAADIGAAISAIPALKRLLIMDTCQSGTPLAVGRTTRNPFTLRGTIERLGRAEGTFTIAAFAAAATVEDVPDLGHGVLTYTLLAGLRAVQSGPLTDLWIQSSGDEHVAYVLPWFSFATAQVPQLTSRYFGQQEDVQHICAGMSFPVLPVPTGKAAKMDPVPTAALPRPDAESPVATTVVRSKQPGGTGDLYLLSVGVNRYTQGAMNLKYAAIDAKAIAELFRNRGPSLYRKVQVQEMLDTQVTAAGVVEAVRMIAKAAGPKDTLVVFLAGHGTLVGQRYYFIPHDFRRKADSLDDDVRSQGLAADVLGDAVASVPALKRILIFDTCASGGALGVGRQGKEPFAFRGAIEQLGQHQGIFTIAASAAGEEAQEIDTLGHGVLTYTLLSALGAAKAGPLQEQGLQPSNLQGLVDVLEWFSYASGQVPRLTKQYLGSEQDVQTSGQGTSFPVLPLERYSSHELEKGD